jgi:hypothetical protein
MSLYCSSEKENKASECSFNKLFISISAFSTRCFWRSAANDLPRIGRSAASGPPALAAIAVNAISTGRPPKTFSVFVAGCSEDEI